MSRTRFAVGDFVGYLASPAGTKVWDMVYAAGVLYHMSDPAHVLRLISQKAKRLVLSTHVYDWDKMLEADRLARAEAAPTDWCELIDPTPVMQGPYAYYRRAYRVSPKQIALGHGASHSIFANMVDAQTLRRMIDDLGGRVVYFSDAHNPRGPAVSAAVDFSHLHT